MYLCNNAFRVLDGFCFHVRGTSMEAKEFEFRKEELVSECRVSPQVLDRVMPRLERFMEPFIDRLVRREQIEHAGMFVRGLLSNLEHKNALNSKPAPGIVLARVNTGKKIRVRAFRKSDIPRRRAS